MIHDYMSLGTAGIVSIASMLVVFSVLLILYVVLIIFGKVAEPKKGQPAAAPAAAAPAAAPAPAAPQQDDGELMAVLAAAIAAYEGKGNPMIRNRGDLD